MLGGPYLSGIGRINEARLGWVSASMSSGGTATSIFPALRHGLAYLACSQVSNNRVLLTAAEVSDLVNPGIRSGHVLAMC